MGTVARAFAQFWGPKYSFSLEGRRPLCPPLLLLPELLLPPLSPPEPKNNDFPFKIFNYCFKKYYFYVPESFADLSLPLSFDFPFPPWAAGAPFFPPFPPEDPDEPEGVSE